MCRKVVLSILTLALLIMMSGCHYLVFDFHHHYGSYHHYPGHYHHRYHHHHHW